MCRECENIAINMSCFRDLIPKNKEFHIIMLDYNKGTFILSNCNKDGIIIDSNEIEFCPYCGKKLDIRNCFRDYLRLAKTDYVKDKIEWCDKQIKSFENTLMELNKLKQSLLSILNSKCEQNFVERTLWETDKSIEVYEGLLRITTKEREDII